MDFAYVKALHIIFVVTWFSGMFYLGRLFIYNREALDRPEPERNILQSQFEIMIRRLLFGICWPSALLTMVFGTWLLGFYSQIPSWLLIKICLVVLLFFYQISLHVLFRQHASGQFGYSGNQLRIWNEVPTVFLISIVFLVVVKQNLSPIYGLMGLVGVVLALLTGIRIYRSIRSKN